MIPPILLFSVCSFFGRLDGFGCIRRHLGRYRFEVEQSGARKGSGRPRRPMAGMLRRKSNLQPSD